MGPCLPSSPAAPGYISALNTASSERLQAARRVGRRVCARTRCTYTMHVHALPSRVAAGE